MSPQTEVDPQQMIGAFDDDEARHGRSTSYLKMGSGDNWIRLLPSAKPTETLLPYRRIRQNRINYTNSDGEKIFRTLLDLQFVLSHENYAQMALEREVWTEDDPAFIETYGDPFFVLRDILQKDGVEWKALPDALRQQEKFLWLALERSNPDSKQIYVYESGVKVRTAVANLVRGEYPELFSPDEGFDINIAGNGKDGRDRRYSDPVPARKSTPVGFNWQENAPDLDKLVMLKTPTFKEKLSHLQQAFPEFWQKYELDSHFAV